MPRSLLLKHLQTLDFLFVSPQRPFLPSRLTVLLMMLPAYFLYHAEPLALFVVPVVVVLLLPCFFYAVHMCVRFRVLLVSSLSLSSACLIFSSVGLSIILSGRFHQKNCPEDLL